MMARQGGPQELKSEKSLALTARWTDEEALGEFHQGPQASACFSRPDIKTATLSTPSLNYLLAKWGTTT